MEELLDKIKLLGSIVPDGLALTTIAELLGCYVRDSNNLITYEQASKAFTEGFSS